VLSESWRERVESFSGRADSVVLPNPVEVPDEPSAGRGGDSVIFLGRLGERKGVYELLEAIELLRKRDVTARWVVAGDGDVEAVHDYVGAAGLGDCVEVPGWVGRDTVRRLLETGAVFCLPSTDEGLPIALLESMAYGLACVVTPVGGIPELVVDGVNGFLVPPRDSVSLANALERVLRDRELAVEVGDRARQDVMRVYAIGHVMDELSSLYRSMAYGDGLVGTAP
jgi:glycosyltransferase involved in cell wall biosynthesis